MFTNRIGFGPRFGATVIDTVFIGLMAVPLIRLGIRSSISSFMTLWFESTGQYDEDGFLLLGFVVGLLISMLAYIALDLLYGLIEALTGASPGKRIMGLQVAHEDGSKGDIQLYLLRWTLKNSGKLLTFILPGISSIAWMVFYFGCFAALGEKKQALHDRIAKSAVYKKADITG
jgi:uncharacterized RDD family membrane protein YckC